MKKAAWVGTLVLALGLVYAADAGVLYARYCQVCHREDGSGTPGTFPSLGGSVRKLATFERGREYLIAVTLFGLKGMLVQGPYTYERFMPGYAPLLDDAEVAALLNWIRARFGWTRPAPAPVRPFTPEEAARMRARSLSPEQVHELLIEAEEILQTAPFRGAPPP
ncbi:c-type cytochrome [Oceanithermus desulfurans]|uniref:Mono/diheme cytochrome c family protein n=1 Tax=Oceanithermus desulfurans TaxID=227924 RepID=A0ABR6P250_9DEIN|nr:cytochrome c [Oceanithermus desulfurans]MBB6029232.1 mono/diheme cytochrome c family protein [Oceanithermus desulfurans]